MYCDQVIHLLTAMCRIEDYGGGGAVEGGRVKAFFKQWYGLYSPYSC